VQRERPILADARQLTELEDGGGQGGAQALENGAAAGRRELADDGGERAADSRDLGQRARFDTPFEISVGQRLYRLRPALVRPGAKRVVARQAKARADLTQRPDDPAPINGVDRGLPLLAVRPRPCSWRKRNHDGRGPARA
jgi:hypothetical protein